MNGFNTTTPHQARTHKTRQDKTRSDKIWRWRDWLRREWKNRNSKPSGAQTSTFQIFAFGWISDKLWRWRRDAEDATTRQMSRHIYKIYVKTCHACDIHLLGRVCCAAISNRSIWKCWTRIAATFNLISSNQTVTSPYASRFAAAICTVYHVDMLNWCLAVPSTPSSRQAGGRKAIKHKENWEKWLLRLTWANGQSSTRWCQK